jgi:hypothetical protein
VGSLVRQTHWLAALVLACLACDDSSCAAVADQLRACCARGPAELSKTCEAEANRLVNDGNADACDTALADGTYARCEK